MAYDLQITNVARYECRVTVAMATGTIVDAFTVRGDRSYCEHLGILASSLRRDIQEGHW